MHIDGKLGLFPFIERVEAQRTSTVRPRGTIITKPVTVNRDRYKEFIIDKVIPAIQNKWPDQNRDITIQHDGASSHIEDDDPEFAEVASAGNWNIKLETQPAKSPISTYWTCHSFAHCNRTSGEADLRAT